VGQLEAHQEEQLGPQLEERSHEEERLGPQLEGRSVTGLDLQWPVKGLDPEPARAQGEREKGLHETHPLKLQHVRFSEAAEAD